MRRKRKQSANKRRQLAKEKMRIKRGQQTAEEAEERKAKERERREITRAEETLKEFERWRAADWLEHLPSCKMFAQNSQSSIYQEIINTLRKATGQEVDVLLDSGCEEEDCVVPTTRSLDHQIDGDVTLDTSSEVHTGQSEASKKVDKDHLGDRKLLQRLEVPHDRCECDLPSKWRQKRLPEKFFKALARATETAEEREEQLQRIARAVARARAAETEEERIKRLQRSVKAKAKTKAKAKAKARARATETEEERRERLRRCAETQARVRANETKERREQRLQREAERRAAQRRAFKEQALLQQHLTEGAETNMTGLESVSAGEVSRRCVFCKASFDNAESLVRHIWVHMEKPYKCPLCLASFFKVSSLNTHIDTIHGGEKPHKCLLCSASFSTFDSLKAHSLTAHTGENPHEVTEINVKGEPSESMDESSFELGGDLIKEEVMDIEVVEHGLDQMSY